MLHRGGIALAWRTRPDEVIAFERKGHGVGLDEPASGVSRLWFYVDTKDTETSATQAVCCATTAAEKIKSDWPSAVLVADDALPCGVD